MDLLKTEHLAVGYHQVTLFKNLNLTLHSNELVCFLGPNGIGKSTLIKTLAGLHPPIHGNIHYNRQGNKNFDITQEVAVVLTDRVTSNLTAYEVITFGRYPYLSWDLSLRTEDKKLIQDAIDQLHLTHLLHKNIQELSDGQLQLVMIARALAQNCQVILLDEPTAHLDLNNRLEIMNLLKGIARHSNKGILISTHELDLALQTADTVWLAGRDQNILTGIPEDLVLNDSFDEIFQLKGFDLKTGKIQHHINKNQKIMLTGTGYQRLWTKNALERIGYEVTDNTGEIEIRIDISDSLQWKLKHNKNWTSFSSLEGLIHELQSSDKTFA